MVTEGKGSDATTIRVRARAVGEYPVRVGLGVIEELGARISDGGAPARIALVSDARVEALHGDRVRGLLGSVAPTSTFTFPAGEASKNRAEWRRLTDEILGSGMGRDGCVVALGGGVTGDLAGFVAATYMRGIPVVQIPTSLVAMIDSAVGGKTGVDVQAGKNLVGAFHPPRFVLVDPEFTTTLPPAERAQGLVEALKHGAILDAAYFDTLVSRAPALLEGDPGATLDAVLPSIRIKADVVSRDELEGGVRQILNFGHTLGHALEAESGYGLPHGTAVARGMVLEALLGERLGVTDRGTAERLAGASRALGIDPDPGRFDADRSGAVLERTRADKKVRAGEVRYVLLERLGRVARGSGWSRAVDDATIRAVLPGPGPADRPGWVDGV